MLAMIAIEPRLLVGMTVPVVGSYAGKRAEEVAGVEVAVRQRVALDDVQSDRNQESETDVLADHDPQVPH